MKPQTVAIAVAVLALPLYAADQQQTKKPTSSTQTQISAPATDSNDSPLVAAAKATGRLGKKPGYVITNETLLRVGTSRLGMSTSQGAALPPSTPAANTPIATPKAQPDAKPKADASAQQRAVRQAQAKADYYGEVAEPRHDDPAQQERQMQQATSPKPPLN